MVRCYILSGKSALAAQQMYSEESLPRLQNAGVIEPQVPNTRTFVRVVQRLLDHGQFTAPAHAKL